MTASSSIDSTVDLGPLGPVRRSAVDERVRHLATVLWLTHGARPRPSGFLHSAVSLDGLPRPLWRSREELAHTASFQHMVNNAPSKPGIKGLGGKPIRARAPDPMIQEAQPP